MAGGVRPTFTTKQLLDWMRQVFEQANLDREHITKQLREDRKRRKKAGKGNKKKKARRHRDSSPSSSSSSTSVESDVAANVMGEDEHDFRRVARERPGITFASVVADTRSQLGQKGFDHDVGTTGPVFWKWMETIFPRKSKPQLVKQLADQGELLMLVTALDELRQGRFLEVADILASRCRALSYWAEKGNWEVGREFLTYMEQPGSLVSAATEDAAARLVEKRAKRERRVNRR